MKRLLVTLVGTLTVAACLNVNAQQVLEDKWYRIVLLPGWTRTESVPQGLDVGYQKRLAEGQYATFYFHIEVMPPEAGEPPSETSGMKRQWDVMLRNRYPDVRSVTGAVPKVSGEILVNGIYELTDEGKKVQRRYTYFLSGKTAFVVQCSAPPAQWPSVLADFDTMLANLATGGSSPEAETKSDNAAITELMGNLPTLLGSFPSQWSCSLGDVAITPATSGARCTLEIKLSFARSDIGDIYKATKLLFGMMKAGKTDADLNSLPDEVKAAASNSSEFLNYIGQVWGYAGAYVASNCSPPIERYSLSILDSMAIRIGSVSISREDGSAILTGKVTPSDVQKVAGMYFFE
jgi:hypothetical protein